MLSILKYLRERQVQKIVSNDPERWAKSRALPSPGQYVFPGRWPAKPQTQPSLNRAMRRFYDNYVQDKDRAEEESLLRIADGYRPRMDDDAFDVLATRRSQVADLIAHANLQAYEQEAPAGLYLAIPFFSRCSDKQPVWLLNRTEQRVTYLRRLLYAYASTDDGIDEYQTAGNAFADGIAASAEIEPGQRLQVEDYSMSFDGDFVSNRRIILLIDGVRSEWFTSISKLGGYLWNEALHGLHRLEKVK